MTHMRITTRGRGMCNMFVAHAPPLYRKKNCRICGSSFSRVKLYYFLFFRKSGIWMSFFGTADDDGAGAGAGRNGVFG